MTISTDETVFTAHPLSDREYAECFDTFKQISTEWDSKLKWLNDEFFPQHGWTRPLNILSVGSGTGDFDLQFMRLILQRCPINSYIAVDPNPDHNEGFQSGFSESGLAIPDFRILPQAFPVQHIDMQFDLVLLTHCLYYMPDRLGAIQSSLDILNDQGLVLVFHQTPRGINEIQRRFLKQAKGDESEMYSSRDIYQLLESISADFTFDIIDGMLDVSDLAAPESRRGKHLLNFFLECRADLLPLTFRQEVVNFIHDLAYAEKDHWVIFHPVGIFCISPSSGQAAV